MSIVNAITAPFSQIPLWRKKSPTPKQSGTATPGVVEDEREEDGFTFVGESVSERDTVYPQNRNIPWESPPPPTYQQVSSLPYSTPYLQSHCDYRRASLPISTSELVQRQTHGDGQEIHAPSSDQPQSNAIHIRDSIQDVPFTLAPHIVGPLSQDARSVQCLPSFDISSFMYDFSFEQRVLSACSAEPGTRQSSHEIDYDRNPGNPPIDE